MQRIVCIDLGLRGDIWPTRDLRCPRLCLLVILGHFLLGTDRLLLDLPIDRLICTQPFAADKVVFGSYRLSLGKFSFRYTGR